MQQPSSPLSELPGVGFLAADPEAGISVMKGLLRQVAKRIRTMNEKLATAEQRASIHHFWTARPQ